MQSAAILKSFVSIRSFIPVKWKIRIDDVEPIINYLICLGKIISANVFQNCATTSKFGELSDNPGQRVLISGFVTYRNVDFNADSWNEARQVAVSSIRRSFLIDV